MPVIERRDQAPQRGEECQSVRVGGGRRQHPRQLGHPVHVDDVEVRIEVPEYVPHERDPGQACRAVIAGVGAARKERHVRLGCPGIAAGECVGPAP